MMKNRWKGWMCFLMTAVMVFSIPMSVLAEETDAAGDGEDGALAITTASNL